MTLKKKKKKNRVKPVRRFNLLREERSRRALSDLKNRSDLVIKPAGKGGAVVVWIYI